MYMLKKKSNSENRKKETCQLVHLRGQDEVAVPHATIGSGVGDASKPPPQRRNLSDLCDFQAELRIQSQTL